MLIASCSKCDEPVTIRLSIHHARSIIRCPLCKAEYELGELFDRLPPAVELVEAARDDMVLDSANNEDERFAGSMFHGAAIGAAMSGSDGESSTAVMDAPPSAGFSFGGPGAATAEPGKAAAFKATPKKKKKPRSVVGEIIKVVGGGVAGLTIATLLLWWAFDKDPLDIAPKAAGVSWLRWAVPAKYHPTAQNGNGGLNGEASGLAQNNAAGPTNPPNRNGQGSGGNAGESLGLPPFGATSDSTETPVDPNTSTPELDPDSVALPDDPLADPLSAGVGPTLDPSDLANTPDEGSSLDDPLASASSGNPATIDTSNDTATPSDTGTTPPPVVPADDEPRLVGVRGSVPVPAQKLAQSLIELGKSIEGWDGLKTSDDKVKKREAGLRFYAALAQVGNSAAFIDTQDPDAPARLDAMTRRLNELAQDAGRVALVQAISRLWLDPAQRSNDGVALAGAVVAIEPTGKMFRVLLQPDGATGEPLELVSYQDPAEGISVGDKLLVVGTLVSEPATNLAGYEGQTPLVTLISMPIKRPSE